MGENIKYKVINEDNIKDVCKIYLDEDDIQMSNDEFNNYVRDSKIIYNNMLNRGCYTYGVFNNEDLVGVINVNKILDYYPRYDKQPYIHLETFIIAKQYQNKGFGTELMKSVLKKVRDEGCSYIIIQSGNKYVQKIAKKCGLTESLEDMRIDFIN